MDSMHIKVSSYGRGCSLLVPGAAFMGSLLLEKVSIVKSEAVILCTKQWWRGGKTISSVNHIFVSIQVYFFRDVKYFSPFEVKNLVMEQFAMFNQVTFQYD